MGLSQRRLRSCETRCHGHDFGWLLGDEYVGEEEGDGGLLLVTEPDIVVACFSEAGVS